MKNFDDTPNSYYMKPGRTTAFGISVSSMQESEATLYHVTMLAPGSGR